MTEQTISSLTVSKVHTFDCVHRLFEQKVTETPQAIAVINGEQQVTYQELNERANQLAHFLLRNGVAEESRVGLLFERSLEFLVGVFAVLKAGGAYVPLDPNYPEERLVYLVEDAELSLILTKDEFAQKVARWRENCSVVNVEQVEQSIAQESLLNPAVAVRPEQLCYMMYTSGSTGKPKGVMVQHDSVVAFTTGAIEAYQIGDTDRMLQFFSVSFDGSVDEIYPALLSGAALVLSTPQMRDDLSRFLAKCEEAGITIMSLPTAYWHELANEVSTHQIEVPEGLRLIIVGGEKLSLQHVERWYERVGDRIRLLNTYGPTEATVEVNVCDVFPHLEKMESPADLPLGYPSPHANLYILNEQLQPLPTGEIGEIFIGGPQVARGYWNRPELTAERFLVQTWPNGEQERLYRTGDLGCWLPDGQLQYAGRNDRQVKVRGFRIELGEVEKVLAHYPPVRSCAVDVRTAANGTSQLAAYIVLDPQGDRPKPSEIRQYVQAQLPEYMVPTAYVLLDQLPLTVNGKVDRNALRSLEPELVERVPFVAPQTSAEQALVHILQELLQEERIGLGDNLLDLGANSLLFMQVVARVRERTGAEVSVRNLFEAQTIGELAEVIEQKQGAETNRIQLPPLVPTAHDRKLPLSYPQAMIWFLMQLAPENLAYNAQVCIKFKGALDREVLRQTFDEIIRRHEMLRTTVHNEDGEPVMVVHPPFACHIDYVDLRALPAEEKKWQTDQLVYAEFRKPFDVTVLPLARWTLLQTEDDEYLLVQVEHHFVHDGWSLTVLMKEMQTIYAAYGNGEPSPLPELAIQFTDFTRWQQQLVNQENLAPQLAYWRKQLSGAQYMELPSDYPRPKVQSFQGGARLYELRGELSKPLQELGSQMGATLFIVLLSAFKVLMQIRTSQDDVVIGSSVANRRLQEAESLIGMIVNPIVLRTDLSGDPTFREVVRRVREVILGAHENQDVPFEFLVRELAPRRELGRNPLFQVNFAFHDAKMPRLQVGDLHGMIEYRHNGSAKFDINITGIPFAYNFDKKQESEGVLFEFEFNLDLYHPATIERLIVQYETLLKVVLENPEAKLSELRELLKEKRSKPKLGVGRRKVQSGDHLV